MRDTEDERDILRDQDGILLNESVRKRVLQRATDFPRLRNDRATLNLENKRMVRLLVQDVTLIRHGDQVHFGVGLRSGATCDVDFTLQAAEHPDRLPAALAVEIRGLLHHHTDGQTIEASRPGPARSRTCAPYSASKPSAKCCERKEC